MRVPVAHLNVDFVVTGSTERHEILFVVTATAGNGENVMDLFHQRDTSFLQTHFTERVLGGITVADAFPRASIGFIHVGTSLILVVLLPGDLLMLGAILIVRQVGAARIRTRVLWLFGHGVRPS